MSDVLKAELHVHLEGTATPALVRRLAVRNRMAVPPELLTADDRYAWRDFLHFLEIYDLASSVICTPEDYYDVTFEYLARCAGENVIYAELMSSPDHAAAAGLSYLGHLDGITRAIVAAKDAYGIEARVIVTGARHLGVDKVTNVARQAAQHTHPLVVGFGLGGDELGFPPEQFSHAFQIARDAGLRCTVHAGEFGGPDSIRAALTLPVERLGHGVRAIEDRNLVAELRERDITLECCPGSNLAIGVYPDYAHHPLPALRAAGVRVTINSDDPPYFATSVGAEYAAAARHFGFDQPTLVAITRDAIIASFADAQTRARLLTRL